MAQEFNFNISMMKGRIGSYLPILALALALPLTGCASPSTETASSISDLAGVSNDGVYSGPQLGVTSADTARLVARGGTWAGILLKTTSAPAGSKGSRIINAGGATLIESVDDTDFMQTNAFALFNHTTGAVDIAAIGATTTIKGTLNVDEAATFDATLGVTGDLAVNGGATMGDASTDAIIHTGRMIVRFVTDVGPMTATAGTVAEIVFNTSDSKFYGCTVSGSPATWSALNL